MKECEGSMSSLVLPEFAWKGFSWCTMISRCQESSGGQPQLGWNHLTLGVTPWARMPRARLELGVFLRLIFQNTSRYMKAKVKSLASSHIFHLTKWCKATCNICSLAAWCMGANYLRWVARMTKLSICGSSGNDLAFLSFLRTQYLYRVGGNALGTWAYLHYSSLYIPPNAVLYYCTVQKHVSQVPHLLGRFHCCSHSEASPNKARTQATHCSWHKSKHSWRKSHSKPASQQGAGSIYWSEVWSSFKGLCYVKQAFADHKKKNLCQGDPAQTVPLVQKGLV